MIFHFTLVNYSNGVRSRLDCSVESHVDMGMVAEYRVTSTVATYVSADPGYSVLPTEIPPLVNENVTVCHTKYSPKHRRSIAFNNSTWE